MSRDREWANDWARCSGKNASYLTSYFVIPTNSNMFSDWRRTCHVSRVKLTVSLGNRTWSGRSPWTAANLWASRRQVNDFFAFFSIFELRGITKHLMTGPAGNSAWVLFPLALNVEGLVETKLTDSLSAYYCKLNSSLTYLSISLPKPSYDIHYPVYSTFSSRSFSCLVITTLFSFIYNTKSNSTSVIFLKCKQFHFIRKLTLVGN